MLRGKKAALSPSLARRAGGLPARRSRRAGLGWAVAAAAEEEAEGGRKEQGREGRKEQDGLPRAAGRHRRS